MAKEDEYLGTSLRAAKCGAAIQKLIKQPWTVSSAMPSRNDNDRSESGSALVYILIAIALLALLTITFMEPSSQQTQSQNTFKTVSELQSQAEFIRSSVQQCVLMHPGGDKTIDNTAAGTDPGSDHRYPINPNSDHFATATITQAGNREVVNIRCPGDPGDDENHAMMFGGSTGKFLPPPPDMFGPWQWYNGADGVFFWIETSRTDAFITTALEKLDEEYADCETDIIDATGVAKDLDEDSTIACPLGSKCFRLWLVADNVVGVQPIQQGLEDSQVATYPDEVGCP